MNPESATGAPLWLDVDTGVDDAIMLMQLFSPASKVAVEAVVAGAGRTDGRGRRFVEKQNGSQ